LEARDDARALRQRVADKLAALDEALIAAVPALLTLLDVPVEAREWERLDSTERRQQTLNALKRLVLQATTWWVGRSGYQLTRTTPPFALIDRLCVREIDPQRLERIGSL